MAPKITVLKLATPYRLKNEVDGSAFLSGDSYVQVSVKHESKRWGKNGKTS